jgi:putative acetyltransferase
LGVMTHAITPVTRSDRKRLFEVWESSVRATHDFLSEADMRFYSPLVHKTLKIYQIIHCVRDENGDVIGFIGTDETRIDMLFVHADQRGKGIGTALMEHAMRELRADEVDVNEQNPAAVGFYQHFGFKVVGRSPLDGTGKPFPILHMALPTAG